MAELPADTADDLRRGRAHGPRVLARLVPLLALLGAAAVPGQGAELDLTGTWYVLVHYEDDGSPNPEQARWLDRVWRFEREEGVLYWTEFPIVLFAEETGRFERRASGQYARILHFWEPNAEQRKEIAAGLKVNSRGSKRRTLRGSDEDGWATQGARAVASASVLTYRELLRIDRPTERPVFSRTDSFSGALAEAAEGITRYETTEVVPDFTLLRGTYTRDGEEHGSFQMLRAGGIRLLGEDSEESAR